MKKLLLTLLVCLLALPATAQDIGGPFSLTTHTGRAVTDKDFLGKYLIVYFGFATCPDICPVTLRKIAYAVDKLGAKADKVQIALITVDPENDTPAKLAPFVTAISPRIVGLTGPRAEIDRVIKEYKIYAQRSQNPDGKGYTYLHADYIFLISPQGTFYSLLQGGFPQEQLAAQLAGLIN